MAKQTNSDSYYCRPTGSKLEAVNLIVNKQYLNLSFNVQTRTIPQTFTNLIYRNIKPSKYFLTNQ